MPPPTRRGGKLSEVEEDAARGVIGPEFTAVQGLLISEVKVLLEVAKDTKAAGQQFGDIMQKTLDYCTKFSKFSTKEATAEVRRLFVSPPANTFTQFEITQLVNLGCESPEEAKALIPSLSPKINDVELDLLLEEIRQLRAMA